MTLFCRQCDGRNEFARNWVEDSDPCKYCGATKQWRTENEPKVAYALSENDRRFLRSVKVRPE